MSFVWLPTRAPKRAHCLGIHHALLPHFNFLFCCIASCAPFGDFPISFESFQLLLSKMPRRIPRDAVIVSLHARLPLSALSNSFCLRFWLHSTSVATDYIFEISLTTRFDWRPSQIFRCARCLATHHVLLFSLFEVSSCCTIPSAPISAFNMAFRRY